MRAPPREVGVEPDYRLVYSLYVDNNQTDDGGR